MEDTAQSPPTRPSVLITGGSRGIGLAVAAALADTHHLLVGGRDREQLQTVCDGFPDAEPWPVDLADPGATAEAAAAIDTLDVMVHSAGVEAAGTVEELTREQWRSVLELNVVAVADLTRLLLPALRRASGQVVMINSGSGYFSTAGGGLYAASKFALRALTDALREEERGRVRVVSIHPGRVDTDMQRRIQGEEGYQPSDHMRPASVAQAVAMAVRTPPDAVVESLSIRPS
ncbi:SDR family oxidoreductase [Auraticoccus monumenti]|uniref:NADP-dependent 3-hydroxy acid dehydrogenase YdfG n=1 Tax=Auraticoccus monumenti TaxID=675864 RepID=A0A1G6XY62_9ACTN|nr:SDR family oxidoreductase [Auraticoccus monumenti]SDD82377.1 NADP-dependent 3-hydroxy acid dehydrogenase YdfG [Auraticoccus monumenti]